MNLLYSINFKYGKKINNHLTVISSIKFYNTYRSFVSSFDIVYRIMDFQRHRIFIQIKNIRLIFRKIICYNEPRFFTDVHRFSSSINLTIYEPYPCTI